MSWFQKLLPPKIKRREGAAQDERAGRPVEQVPVLPGGAVQLRPGEEPERLPEVQPSSPHHGARARLDLLLDAEGRFEIGAEVLPVDTLKFKDSKRYPDRLVAAQRGAPAKTMRWS